MFSVKSGYLAYGRRRTAAAIFCRLLGFKLDLYLSERRQEDRRVTAKELKTKGEGE